VVFAVLAILSSAIWALLLKLAHSQPKKARLEVVAFAIVKFNDEAPKS